MKKLIIALAVVAMAVCSQAATYKWKCSSMRDYAGNTFSGTVTLVNVQGLTSDNASLNASGSSSSQTLADVFEEGTSYSFYVTYSDAEGNVFRSASKGSVAQIGSTPSMTFTMSGGTWTPAPEPTSAMLLLLGVAGLTLKRKQK